jgi:MoaA/NifB/PqqE/SkfB family radical SAM enzyme
MRYAANATIMNQALIPAMVENNLAEIPTFPEQITLTTSLNCNYRCRMCYQQSYAKAEIAWAVVEKVAEVLPFVDVLQIFGGEPLLYSRFFDLVQLADQAQAKVRIVTNGSLLDERARLRLVENQVFNVKVSLDAGTAKTYQHIRGGNFLKLTGNLSELHKLKKAVGSTLPLVEFNVVAQRSNILELPKILILAQNMGIHQVNVYYMNCTREDWAQESLWFHQNLCDEALAKAGETAKVLGVRVSLPKPFKGTQTQAARVFSRCEDPWRSFLVDVSGAVTPCCGGAPSIGSLANLDFSQVWNSASASSLRRTVNSPDKPDYCKNCFGRMQDESSINTHFSPAIAAKLLTGWLPKILAA